MGIFIVDASSPLYRRRYVTKTFGLAAFPIYKSFSTPPFPAVSFLQMWHQGARIPYCFFCTFCPNTTLATAWMPNCSFSPQRPLLCSYGEAFNKINCRLGVPSDNGSQGLSVAKASLAYQPSGDSHCRSWGYAGDFSRETVDALSLDYNWKPSMALEDAENCPNPSGMIQQVQQGFKNWQEYFDNFYLHPTIPGPRSSYRRLKIQTSKHIVTAC